METLTLWNIFLLFFVTYIVFVFVLLAGIWRHQKITLRFQFLLAFRILPGYTSEVEKGLRQRIIDDELVYRALRFFEEDMKERKLLQRRGELQSAEEPRKVLWTCRWLTMRLRLQKILVKREKRRFWGPVNLARTFGYEVKEKYHDYLPPVLPRLPEEERAALELRASPED